MKNKTVPSKRDDDQVAVEALAHFKHDGKDVAPRDVVIMSTANADDLVAIRFARHTTRPARG